MATPSEEGYVPYVSPVPDDWDGEPESAELTDKAHVPNYVPPRGAVDKTPPGETDKGHIKPYVAPLPEPEDEPEPDPVQVAREAHEKELREHEALVRRLQEEDRKRIQEERAQER